MLSAMTHIRQICGIFDVAISHWISSNVISMVPFTHVAFLIVKNHVIKRGLEQKNHVIKKITMNLPYVCHGTYHCIRNAAMGFSPYYLLFGREPRLPVDVEFGLQKGNQKGSLGESSYISQLKRRLKFAHNKAKHMAKRQQAKHRELYDQKCRGAELEVGDLVLVKQTAWKGRHKIQDKWEIEEYQVVDQPSPGIPVHAVKSVAGGRTRVLHRNLLLPLQGKIRQDDGMWEEGISDEMRCPMWLGLYVGGLGEHHAQSKFLSAEGGL